MTGARGYIGSALVAALTDHKAHVYGVARAAAPEPPGIVLIPGDIRVRETWDELVDSCEIIFHLAGNTSIYVAADDPAASFDSTVLPVTHFVAAAAKRGVHRRLILASTATLYGMVSELPVSEERIPVPATVYDLHKLFAEQQMLLGCVSGQVDGAALRLANVYGPSTGASSAPERGVLNKVTRAALAGIDLTVYGTGDYLRDYVFMDDVVSAFLAAGATRGLSGRPFNVATGQGISVRAAFELVADRAAAFTGKRIAVQSVPWPKEVDPIEARNFVGNSAALGDTTGWKAEVTLTDGIDRLIRALS